MASFDLKVGDKQSVFYVNQKTIALHIRIVPCLITGTSLIGRKNCSNSRDSNDGDKASLKDVRKRNAAELSKYINAPCLF